MITSGGQTLISEPTRHACGDSLTINQQLEVRPKGFDQEISLFDIADIDTDTSD